MFEPADTLEIIKDEADNRLLELAKISKADFIITGNSSDFTMKIFESTKIVTPKSYWENNK